MFNIVPTRLQKQILLDNHRFQVCLSSRQVGKTSLCAMILYRSALLHPKGVSLFFAPTHTRAGELMWKRLLEGQLPFEGPLLPKEIIKSKSLTTQTIELHNNHIIKLIGADSLQSIVGWTADQIIFDEFQDVDPQVWAYAMPMLGARGGRAAFNGTARGKNHFYDLWLLGSDVDELGNPNPKRHPDWMSWRISTEEGGCMRTSEVELARSVLSKREFEQEFMASFSGFAGQVYEEFDARNVTPNIALDPIIDGQTKYPPIMIGLDFNVSPMSASVHVQDPKNPEILWCVDEIVLQNSDVYKMRTEIRNRYQLPYPGRPILVFPDPAGAARSAVGNPAHELLAEYGFEVMSRRSSPAIMARVLAVKARICNAKGERRYFVHPRCANVIKGLTGQVWNAGKNEPDKKMGLDHLNDGIGYMIEFLHPIGGNYMSAEPIAQGGGGAYEDEFAEMDQED